MVALPQQSDRTTALKVFAGTLAAMTVYETVKELWAHGALTMIQSHVVTVLFVSFWAAIVSLVITKRIGSLRDAATTAETVATVTAKQLEDILKATPIALFVKDGQSRFLMLNRACEAQFGMSASDLVGTDGSQFFPENQMAHFLSIDRAVFDGGQLIELEESVWSAAHGETRDCHTYKTPVFDNDGTPKYLVCATIDITDRKNAQRRLESVSLELQRSNADLEQFSYAASHDLLEPLRSISGSVQLLKKRYAGHIDASADEFIAHAVAGAARMQQIINDLLVYARLSASGQVKERVKLATALHFALNNLSSAIAETQAEFIVDDLPEVLEYKGQMSQLFQNLIGNALKFRGDKTPLIRISVTEGPQEWVIAVKDNGIGIEPQHFERVFKLFKRLHSGSDFAGTGIGLTLCQKIVERHYGRIWLESHLGQGTTFFFSLPRSN